MKLYFYVVHEKMNDFIDALVLDREIRFRRKFDLNLHHKLIFIV